MFNDMHVVTPLLNIYIEKQGPTQYFAWKWLNIFIL